MRPSRNEPPAGLAETQSPESASARAPAETVVLPLLVPGRFGPFELLQLIGRGAQAEVYRARWAEGPQRGEELALKLLDPGYTVSDRARARFERESRLAASLELDGICRVLGTGECEGRSWCAMELVDGRSLAERIALTRRMRARHRSARPHSVLLPQWQGEERTRAALPRQLESLCLVFERFAAVLHDLHAHGIVHRDVKPGNLMLDGRGRAVLLDLGVAGSFASEEGETLTHTGAVLGSPAYMAPEQIRGELERQGPATDVWGLGVCLYECLTLERPFDGEHREELFRQILIGDAPEPGDFHPGLPLGLRAVLAQALQKRPEKRYPSTQAFAEDLARVRRGEPTRARVAGPADRLGRWVRRRPRTAALLLSVSTLLIGGLLVSLLLLRDVLLSREETQILSAAAATSAAAIAVEQGDGDRGRLLLARVPESLPRVLGPDVPLRGFAWRWLDYQLDPRHACLPVPGGELVAMHVGSTSEALRVLDATGRLHDFDPGTGAALGEALLEDAGPSVTAAFAQGGQRLARVVSGPDGLLEIRVHDAAGREELRVPTRFEARPYPPILAWSRSGRFLLVAGEAELGAKLPVAAWMVLGPAEGAGALRPVPFDPEFRHPPVAGAVTDEGALVLAFERRHVSAPLRVLLGDMSEPELRPLAARLPQQLLALRLREEGRVLHLLLREGAGSDGDVTLERWRLDEVPERLDRLVWPDLSLRKATFSRDGERIAVQTHDEGLVFCDLTGARWGPRLLSGTLHRETPVFDAEFEHFAVPLAEGIALYERARLHGCASISRSEGSVASLAFDASGQRLAVGRQFGLHELLSLPERRRIASFDVFGPGLVSVDPAGERILWAAGDRRLGIVPVRLQAHGPGGEQVIGRWPYEGTHAAKLALGAGCAVVRVPGENARLELLGPDGAKLAGMTLPSESDELAVAAQAPVAGALLRDGSLCVLDAPAGQVQRFTAWTEPLGRGRAAAFALHPRGRWVAAASAGRILVFDRESESQVLLDGGRSHRVRTLAFFAGAPLRIASVHEDGSLTIWLVERRIDLMHQHLGLAQPTAIAVDLAGERIAVGGADGSVHVLDPRRGARGTPAALPASPHWRQRLLQMRSVLWRPFRSVEILRRFAAGIGPGSSVSIPAVERREIELTLRLHDVLAAADPEACAALEHEFADLQADAPDGTYRRIAAMRALLLRFAGQDERARECLAAAQPELRYYAWMYAIAAAPHGPAAYRLARALLDECPTESEADLLDRLREEDAPEAILELVETLITQEQVWPNRLETLHQIAEAGLRAPLASDEARIELQRVLRTLCAERSAEREYEDLLAFGLVRAGELTRAEKLLYRRLHSKQEKLLLAPPLPLAVSALLRLERDGPTQALREWCDAVLAPVLRLPAHEHAGLAHALGAELRSRLR